MSNGTRNRSDSPTKNCVEDGCGKPLRARGLCLNHYNLMQYGPDRVRHPKVEVVCDNCGQVVLKYPSKKFAQRYCSYLCRDFAQHGPMACVVPMQHASRLVVCQVPRDHPSRKPEPRPPVPCEWCDTETDRRRYCSLDCKRRAKVARRRGREADGHTYSWSHVMRVHLLLDARCVYCDQVVDGPPDPDHVVPISRGGSNGNANILPSCRSCNSDKRDLLLHEWAEDRARRGKPPVRTILDRSLPAFAHLLPDALASSHAT